jgi:hypothetical protein
MAGIEDFQVICDERNNPPGTVAREERNVHVDLPDGYFSDITLDRQGRVIRINGVDVKDILYPGTTSQGSRP